MGKDTRGSRDYPQTQLPPLSAPGVTRVAMDRADGLWKASENGAAYIPILTSGGAAGVLQTVSVNASTDLTTTAIPPVYTPLFSVPITTTLAASRLRIDFFASWNHGGAFAGNVAANFRFLRNAVLLPATRGTTGNELRGRIVSSTFMRVLPVVAGLHTILVEWAGFALAGNSLNIFAATAPDLFGAQLIVQELPP